MQTAVFVLFFFFSLTLGTGWFLQFFRPCDFEWWAFVTLEHNMSSQGYRVSPELESMKNSAQYVTQGDLLFGEVLQRNLFSWLCLLFNPYLTFLPDLTSPSLYASTTMVYWTDGIDPVMSSI